MDAHFDVSLLFNQPIRKAITFQTESRAVLVASQPSQSPCNFTHTQTPTNVGIGCFAERPLRSFKSQKKNIPAENGIPCPPQNATAQTPWIPQDQNAPILANRKTTT